MARRLRRALSFANVCSFLALTIAMGTGGAYAANTIFSADIVDGEVKTADLASASVTSSKVLNDSLLSSDIQTGAVTISDIAINSVTTSRVVNGSLLGKDLAPDAVTGTEVDETSLAKVPQADTLDGLDSTEFLSFSNRFGNGGNASGGRDSTVCTLAEIGLTAARTLPGGFIPAHGQVLPINQNQALFSLLGTTYGGNGMTTFALPDMRPIEPDNMTYGICINGVFPSPT